MRARRPLLAEDSCRAGFDRAENVDLLNAVDRWFKKYPKKLDDLSLLDELGEVHKLALCPPHIAEAW